MSQVSSLATRRHRHQVTTIPAMLSLVLGCTIPRSVEVGRVPVLGRNEGLLVVHIQSALPIRQLSIDRVTAIRDLEAGEHLHLLVVGAGRHHWSGIVIAAGEGAVPFRMSSEEWGFRVESGRTNYVDSLIVRGNAGKTEVEIGGGRKNRSAEALRKLLERFPDVLARYPPIYSGPSPDHYLEYYSETFLKPGAGAAQATAP